MTCQNNKVIEVKLCMTCFCHSVHIWFPVQSTCVQVHSNKLLLVLNTFTHTHSLHIPKYCCLSSWDSNPMNRCLWSCYSLTKCTCLPFNHDCFWGSSIFCLIVPAVLIYMCNRKIYDASVDAFRWEHQLFRSCLNSVNLFIRAKQRGNEVSISCTFS